MWLSATEVKCQKYEPENCGWILDSSTQSLQPKWFEGEPTPLTIEDIIKTTNTSDTPSDMLEDSNISDVEAEMSDYDTDSSQDGS